MVNDILDFSRLEANDSVEKSSNNIVELVENCANQVQVLLQEHNLKISISKEDDIPIATFNYDSIERALTNYISNAIKYSPENGEIKIAITTLNNKNDIQITVTDQGCGIAPKNKKKVFDRFFRVENDTHTVKGTGLGLHLVKTTIEKHHGGKVFVESEPGKGSTFGFIIPVVPVERNITL